MTYAPTMGQHLTAWVNPSRKKRRMLLKP